MPKATVQEEEVPVEASEPPQDTPEVPDTPQPEEVAVKPKSKASAKRAARGGEAKAKDAPKSAGGAGKVVKKEGSLDLKQKHTCGACGKVMSLHSALYGHKNCPGEASIPQPPALTRQVAAVPEPVYEPPQMSHAQLVRMHLAQAAQERRAQAQLRMTAPIRQFYGL